MTSRTEVIIAMRDEGKTLQQIGEEVGLTRERVRQILRAEGLKTWRHADRMDAAIQAWRASGELRRPEDVAVEHGIVANTGNVAALRRACPDLTLPDTKRAGSRWNRTTVAAIIRRIAGEQGLDLSRDWIRMTDYDKWRYGDDPSTATIGANYVWSELLVEAGFDIANAHKRGRQPGIGYREFDDEAIDNAVQEWIDSKPAKLSALSLESYLADREWLPSMATIRNRYRKRGIPTIRGIITTVTGSQAA